MHIRTHTLNPKYDLHIHMYIFTHTSRTCNITTYAKVTRSPAEFRQNMRFQTCTDEFEIKTTYLRKSDMHSFEFSKTASLP